MALVVPGALPLPGAAHVWRQPGAARPQAQHLRSGRSGLGALAGLGWAGLRRTRIPARAKPKPDPSTYVPVLLEMPEGQTYQIEARPVDTVKILKAVLNLELGLSEAAMDLSFDGKTLEDDLPLSEIDLKEGTKLQLSLRELDEEELEAEAATGVRIFIKVDSQGKPTKLTLDLDPEERIEDVKLEAYEQFRDKVPFLCDLAPRHYGLFLLDGVPVADSRGNLRYLKKSEMLKDDQTVAESGLEGGEEVTFANLMWLDRTS